MERFRNAIPGAPAGDRHQGRMKNAATGQRVCGPVSAGIALRNAPGSEAAKGLLRNPVAG